jgi:purine-binding chemotaxis protein CheW
VSVAHRRRAVRVERVDFVPAHGAPAPPATAAGAALTAPLRRVRACLVVLGGEEFAVDVRHLREVMVVERLTAIPGVPSFVRGLLNLRGEVLTLLDVAPALGLPAGGLGSGSKALVLEPASSQVAVGVEQVVGLETFDEFGPGEDAALMEQPISEMRWVQRDGRLVARLDLPQVVEALRRRCSEAVGAPGRRGPGGREGAS